MLMPVERLASIHTELYAIEPSAHAAVFDGLPLKVNHWHTEQRPTPRRK